MKAEFSVLSLLLWSKYFPQTAEEERFVTVCSFRTLGLWLLGPWATQNTGTVGVCHGGCLLLPRSRREHDPKEWGVGHVTSIPSNRLTPPYFPEPFKIILLSGEEPFNTWAQEEDAHIQTQFME